MQEDFSFSEFCRQIVEAQLRYPTVKKIEEFCLEKRKVTEQQLEDRRKISRLQACHRLGRNPVRALFFYAKQQHNQWEPTRDHLKAILEILKSDLHNFQPHNHSANMRYKVGENALCKLLIEGIPPNDEDATDSLSCVLKSSIKYLPRFRKLLKGILPKNVSATIRSKMIDLRAQWILKESDVCQVNRYIRKLKKTRQAVQIKPPKQNW